MNINKNMNKNKIIYIFFIMNFFCQTITLHGSSKLQKTLNILGTLASMSFSATYEGFSRKYDPHYTKSPFLLMLEGQRPNPTDSLFHNRY
jgi:hypothetical protein